MPLFDYLCPDCGQTSEILMTAAAEAPVCPACGSQDAERLFSVFAGRVEGNGGCGTTASGGG